VVKVISRIAYSNQKEIIKEGKKEKIKTNRQTEIL
jgi:hypothetical protein